MNTDRKGRRWCLGLGLGGIVAAPIRPLFAASTTVIVQGSTTVNLELLAPHKEAIEAGSQASLTVIPNKSNRGLLALLEGRADLAMISTPLDNEVGALRQTNPDLPTDSLQSFEVGRTGASLIVNARNPVRSISVDDLRRVLKGDITNWRQLGGPDRPIRVIAVREGGGVVTTVETAVLGAGLHITAPDQIRVQNGPQVSSVVEQEEDALGITQLKSISGHQVSELATERPFEQVLFLVSLGPPKPALRAVIAACRTVAATQGMM